MYYLTKIIQELDEDDRYRCCLINEVIDEDRTVDQSKTRFLRYEGPEIHVSRFFRSTIVFTAATFVCEIRRNDPTKLDLDVLWVGLDPIIAAGPPFDRPFELGDYFGQLWEPYYMGDSEGPEIKEHMDLLLPFLRDWLSGRLTVTTTYVDDVPYHLTLKRGDEVIGERRDRRIRLFDKRREVTRHT